MKKYRVVWAYVMRGEAVIEANDEASARVEAEKYRLTLPQDADVDEETEWMVKSVEPVEDEAA